jgi:protein O-mannosyl-transferase
MSMASPEQSSLVFDRWSVYLKRYPYAAGALLALVAGGIFAGILANGFVYDDEKQLLENPFVRNPHLWPRIFTGSVWSFLGAAAEANFYRPLHIFSYWLIYRLAGLDPAAYHAFQWLLYMATTLLVFELGRQMLASEPVAFAGALLWALHPLHVEAVAWIAAVPEVGCGFFYLLAFWLFLRVEKSERGRSAKHALAALAYLPALFFKEAALSFPLLLLAYWFFFPAKDSWRARIVRWLPYLGATAVYVGARVAALGHFSHSPHYWKVSPREVGAAIGLLGQHAKLFFWPTNLNVFRTFELSASLRSPWAWLTLLVVLAAFWYRRRRPLLCFLIIWWVITLLPCLDVRQLSFPLLAERFSYLPSVGLCLALGSGFWMLPRRLALLPLAPVVLPALGVLLTLWALQDLRAIPRWRNNDVLWNYSFRASPNAGLVHVHRGLDLQFREHDLEGAAREFQTALRLNRASFLPLNTVTYDSYIGLGQVADLEGRHEEALDYFNKAVRALPFHSLAYDVLGSVYFPRGDYARAAEYFERAVQVNPQDLGALFYLGTCWMKLGRLRQAAEQFHAAREVDPEFKQAFEAEAQALEAAGETVEAARVRSLVRGH